MEAFWNSVLELCTTVGASLLYAVIVLVVGLKLVKWFVKWVTRSKGFAKLDPGVQSFVRSGLSILLNVLVLISVAVILGIPTTSFITMLASAGVAIGLALQGSLSNFAGGLMLLLFKPVKVGDFIESSGASGTVTDISIFYTTLLTPDNRHITLPNGSLSNSDIVNYSSEAQRRVDLTFSVSYSADIEQVKGVLLHVARSHALVKQEPEPMARLTNQGDSALEFVLRVWCETADYWTVRFDLYEEVKKVFDQHGIEIPFPQLDVHMRDGVPM